MNIMLACAQGMSTSLVVAKMKEAAERQGKSDYKIWAIEQADIESELGNFDVLLLGPQVRHILKKVTKIVGDKAPIDIIAPLSYAKCDGDAILKQAEDLVK